MQADSVRGSLRGGNAPLFERARELDVLALAVDRAAQGVGGVVVVEGAAGIGKSSLLEAASQRARGLEMTVLTARGAALERSYPFGLAAQLLAGHDRELRAAPPAHDSAEFDGEAERFAVIERIWERLRARQPALLAVDDMHWADPESLRLLAFLAARVGREALLLLATLRPTEPGSSSELLGAVHSTPGASVLTLAPLTTAGIEAVLRARGLPQAGPELVAACRRSTGGNPYLLQELARMLTAGGAAATRAVAHLEQLAPAGLGRAVLARLATLSADATAVCEALAVLGGRAETRVVAALAQLNQRAVAATADLLAEAHILERGRPLEFVHPLVCQAIYQDMPRAARDRVHRAAARLLNEEPAADSDLVAAHLLQADPSGDAWVAETLELAARCALAAAAPESAETYLERALREPPPAGRMVELLTTLATARLRASKPVQAVEALELALTRADEPVARARIAARLHAALTSVQRGDHGARLLVTAIAELPSTERELGLELEAELRLSALLQADAARATVGRRPRFKVPRRAARSRGELLAIAAEACHVSVRGSADEAGNLAELVFRDGALLTATGPESPLLHLAVYALIHTDRLARADRILTEAIELAREHRSRLGEAIARAIRADARQRAGRLSAALEDATAALDATRHGLRFGPRPAVRALVLALLAQGRPVEAAHALDRFSSEEPVHEAATAAVAYAQARLHAACGRHQQAIAACELCAELEAEFEVTPPVLAPWRSTKARSLLALERRSEAQSLARDEVRLARAYGARRSLGIALIAAGEIDDDPDCLREAVATLECSEARLEHARALIALGSALRRRGQRAAAREQLEDGMQVARACAAAAIVNRARDELKAAGARPRKIVYGGVDELTAAERRVAELAADGLSNRQIANRLSISVRTVESHLAHTYQKLGIGGRHELATLLTRNQHPTASPAPPERRARRSSAVRSTLT